MATRLEHIRVHEAAHSAAALAHGCKVTEVRATYNGGHCLFDSSGLTATENVLVSLAGIAAEETLLGEALWSNKSDWGFAEEAIGPRGSREWESRLSAIRGYVFGQQEQIKFLARALEAMGGTLHESEIAELCWANLSPLKPAYALFEQPRQPAFGPVAPHMELTDRIRRERYLKLGRFLGNRRCFPTLSIAREPQVTAANLSPLGSETDIPHGFARVNCSLGVSGNTAPEALRHYSHGQWALAIHEAAHAVAAVAMGLKDAIRSLTIVADPLRGFAGAMHWTHKPADKFAIAVAAMAGPIAEARVCESSGEPSGADARHVVESLAEIPESMRASTRDGAALRAREIINQHWSKVTALAKRLQATKQLTGSEVVAFVQ